MRPYAPQLWRVLPSPSILGGLLQCSIGAVGGGNDPLKHGAGCDTGRRWRQSELVVGIITLLQQLNTADPLCLAGGDPPRRGPRGTYRRPAPPHGRRTTPRCRERKKRTCWIAATFPPPWPTGHPHGENSPASRASCLSFATGTEKFFFFASTNSTAQECNASP